MRTLVLGIICAFCLTLFTSCDEMSSSSFLPGEWSGPAGRSMIFYPNGRVAVRDSNGVDPNCAYEFDTLSSAVKITRPEGGGTLEAVAITRDRLEFKGQHGKTIIFNRRGT